MRIGVVQEGDEIFVAHIDNNGNIIGSGRMFRLHNDGTWSLCQGVDIHHYGMPTVMENHVRKVAIRGINITDPDA